MGQIKALSSEITCLAYSPDLHLLACGGKDHSIVLWEAHTGKRLSTGYQGHLGEVSVIAFSNDSKSLMTGSADCSARVWNAEAAKEEAAAQHRLQLEKAFAKVHKKVVPDIPPTYIHRACFGPSGIAIIVDGDMVAQVGVWSTKSGKMFCEVEGAGPVFSPSGKMFAATVALRDAVGLQTGSIMKLYQSRTGSVEVEFQCRSISFSPEGKRMLLLLDPPAGGPKGDAHAQAQLWSIDSNNKLSLSMDVLTTAVVIDSMFVAVSTFSGSAVVH
eukprot:gene31396-6559_t